MTGVSFDPGSARYAWQPSPRLGDAPALVVLPVGATEQHGPHLPVGVDSWLAEAVALRAAAIDGATLVAGALPYGCSAHHTGFPGTVTLRPRVFIDVVLDVCRSLHRDGHTSVVVNGHGGNRGPLQVALAELLAEGITAWAVSYFELVGDVAAELFPDPATATGHACALETSLILHLWPAAVDRSAVPPGGTPPSWPDPHLYATGAVQVARRFEAINPTGVIGRPSDADAEAGRRLFEAAADRLADVYARIRKATP
ncbi:creatininase family protein [Asanoa sp. NPDC050611]|uniref:creatininase family protein n=1 Tax=Asanoa sp. NPDC050611 TaxID=3157098 RepID=UPI0034009325